MPRITPRRRMQIEKAVLGLLLASPLALIVYDFFTGNLGANPVEEMTHRTGYWSLRILMLSLAVTPAVILFRWRKGLVFRRMIGLFAFFYAVLHLAIYLVFDQELDFRDTIADVGKRPYIAAGFAAFLLMAPLAVTSTNRMVKRLGPKRWKRLHRAAYLVALLAVVHYLWLVKADTTRPLAYGLLLAGLLSIRAYDVWRRRRAPA